MTTMTFDKLAYIDRLKAIGFTESQARGMADGLDQALREEVATKADIASVKGDITSVRGDITSVRGEIAAVRNEMGLLRTELKSEFGAGLAGLRAEMKVDKVDILKWVVMLIVGQTAVFTALKLLGH